MKKSSRILILSLAFIVVVTGLAGCGESVLTLDKVLKKSEDAVLALKSYRVDLETVNEQDSEITTNIDTIEFVAPDRVRSLGKTEENALMICIGKDQYLSFDRETWQVYELNDSQVENLNSAYGTIKNLQGLIETEQLDDESINGVTCLHYKGEVDVQTEIAEKKKQLDPESSDYQDQLQIIEASGIWERAYEFWIGKDDHLLYKVVNSQEAVLEDNGEERSMKVRAEWTYYDFNADITIEPPSPENIEQS